MTQPSSFTQDATQIHPLFAAVEMSPNVPPVGRAGSDSCLGAGVLQAAKGGGLGLLLTALAQK